MNSFENCIFFTPGILHPLKQFYLELGTGAGGHKLE